MSPTQRTLAYYRAQGWTVADAQRRIPHTFISIDLFGFLDYLALKSGETGVLGLQITSGSNHAARVEKIRQEPNAGLWLDCSNRIQVVSWSKKGARGKPKTWEPRIQEIRLEDLSRPVLEGL